MNPGDRYGRYQIIRLVGRGAMGEVFLARNLEAGREIALKVVYKGPESEDQDILNAERLGADLQKRLSGVDRRVVIVHDYGEISGDLYVEMEYIAGEDLSTILTRGSVNAGFAVHVARELCEMLENLRSFTTTIADRRFSGVVHGDLKPRNVRINQQNQVKVLDFGIAKALSHTRKYTMNVFASTAYCSPERLETQNIDTHSDLWSVGVLLYQMMANDLPFSEPSKERLERRIRSGDPPPPLPRSCPEHLSLIILKMLARNPAQRYQTPSEAVDDLGRLQKGQAVKAEPPRPIDAAESDATIRTGPAIQQSFDDSARTVRTPPPSLHLARPHRNRWLLGGLTAVAVAGLLVGTYIFIQLRFWNDAGELKSDLQTERVTNLDQAWSRYEILDKRNHLPIFLWGAERALKNRLIGAADEIIDEYRNSDSPSVYEPQWIQAHNDLARALQLDADDSGIKGRLRLCEGHIDRIEAGGLRSSARQKRLNTAVNKFNEAAELLKHSPDPYLGLANLYIYDLNDVQRAEDALNKAARYGHPIGNRETAQLADGYRRRADRMWRQSRSLTQLPGQERDYLDKARQDYIHAQDLYQQAGVFGDAARNRLQAFESEQRVEARLTQLQASVISQ